MQQNKFPQRQVVHVALGWLFLVGGFALIDSASAAEGKVFRAGASVVDITPTNYPVLVNAMFTERSATNAVDPLEVRALALDDGETRLVLAVVDTCMIARDLIDRAKEQASQATGIPTDKMLVSATHTHSAPSAMGCLGSRQDTNYAAFLPPRIAAAIVGAVKNLQPARIGWGVADDWEHTFNRRWIRRPDKMLTDPFGDRNIRAHMHPGHESPDAVGPSGPVDPGLSVIAVRSADGRPLALLANYSQHYYGSPLLSSDYYGRFRRHVAALLESPASVGTNGFVAMMSQGTSGDLMWMDYSAPAKDIGYDAYARAVAEKVAAVVRDLKFHDWVPLKMAERTLALNYRVPDEARLAWARKTAQSFAGRLPGSLPEIYALEAIHLHERPRTELKLQALRIGDLGITALPNEVFALTGLKLKAQSPFATTFNIELANGAEGYIPPPEQHKLGGYTTWPARTAGLEFQAEPRIVETLLSLLEEVSGQPRRVMTESHGAYAKAIFDSKPAAYWRLSERVIPTAFDATGQGRNAQYEDGIALYLPGASRTVGFQPAAPEVPNTFSGDQINRAPHFAGGRLRATMPELKGAYSVEFWFWNGLPHSLRSITGNLFSRGADGVYGAPGEHLSIGGTNTRPGRLVFANGGSDVSQSLVGRTDLALRTWYHVALVRDGKRVGVYLNGNPVPEIIGEIEPGVRLGANTIFLGGRSDNVANFEGKLDEVALYDRALGPDEIAEHFRAAGFPAAVNPVMPAALPAGNTAQALETLKPVAHWLAPVADERTVLSAVGQPAATAEAGVDLPAPDAVAASFAGGRLRASVPSLGSNYSVALWFFNELPNTSRPVTAYLFSRGEDGAEGAPGDHIGIGGTHSNAGQLILFNGNTRDELLAGRRVIPPQTWNHLVLVREGRRVSVYLNGERKPEIAGELEPGHPPGVDQIFFGGRNDNFSNLRGKLSDIAVFNRALKPEEIPAINQASRFPARTAANGGTPGGGSALPIVSPPLSPSESLTKIHLREGFKVELVAAEPLLESPVAIDWDERGRLWVVEMVDYPLGLDGKGKPGGRVRMLEDTDGDGRYDKTTLFADGLAFPTGILTWRDGVIISAAPEILFLKDSDGDGKADVREVLFSGFLAGNQQLRVNGLRWGLDNWVYCASGAHHGGYGTGTKIKSHRNSQEYAIGSRDFRFRPDTGELDAQSGPSQFGRNPDDWGNWFGVQNSWPLWHYVLQDHYIRRNPHVPSPDPVQQVVTPMNPPVFPMSQREKRFHSFSEAGHFTSACAAMIYRDELLFGADGARHAFTCEPFHNLVQHNVVTDDGPSFSSHRASEEAKRDFFASEDRWCRPVMTRTGPDGALWVVDMYRYMIEHPEWLPAEGKAELLPHYRLGEERGRIYRVFPSSNPPRKLRQLGTLSLPDLVSALDSPNGWQRDKVQMLLLWKKDAAAAPLLEQLARVSTNPLARLQALCTLDGLGRLPPALVEHALADPHPGVRINALRLAEPRSTPAVIAAAAKLVNDANPKVRLQLACTLGEWDDPQAGAALGQLAVAQAGDKFLTAAILSSALPHSLALVDAVVAAGEPAQASLSEPLINLALATNQRDSLARLLKPTLTPIRGEFTALQMAAFSQFLDTLDRRKTTWRALQEAKANDALAQQLLSAPELFAAAKRLAADVSQPEIPRIIAAGLLVRDEAHQNEALLMLSAMLSPKTSGEAQRAAIKAFGVRGHSSVPDLLAKAWPTLGPETRLAVLNELLSREAWAFALVGLVESGQISPNAFDATRRERLLRHSSARVKQAATKALNAGERSTRAKVIADFRPALALPGDATRGAAVFAKLCAICHKLGPVGNEIGPNLQSVANHPPEKLLVSILDPNASIEPGYTAYTAQLSGGEELYGIIAAETGNSLVLKLPDGKTRTLLRSNIDALHSANLSLMPEGLEAGMSQPDLADLIRFLQTP